MFTLDRSSPIPLADQIEQAVRELILGGRLPSGSRLMSLRALAAQLAVSPNTVVLAYDRLAASALIDARGTAGYFVRDRARAPGLDAEVGFIEAGEEQEAVWLAQQASDQRAGVLLASSGALPASWLEDAVPAAAVQRGLARSAAGMAARCPPQGLPALRERLALLLRGQGIAADPACVMTTSGGTQAMDLICRALLRPGDAVVVEDPGYFLMLERLRADGLNIIRVKRGPEGLDLQAFEEACIAHRPRLLFVQSVLHNPTGWGSSPALLHKLLVLARRYGVLIAEDDVHGHFHPGAASRLAALSGLEQVIYYSSFCKALSPALRMGYLAAEPALLKPLLRAKIYSVLTNAALNEYVLLEVLAAGRWRKHLERLQRQLATARQSSMAQLQSAGVQLAPGGEGGLFLWGRVAEGIDVELLVQDAFRHKILLAKGSSFSAEPDAARHLRFNVAYSQHTRLADYLRSRLQALDGGRQVLARAAQGTDQSPTSRSA